MKLRTQLILAFLLLAIVPLAALTFYSYSTSIRAFRQAMKEEAGARTLEMRDRMEDVSRDLTQRIEDVGALPLHRLVDYDTETVQLEAEQIYKELRERIGDDVTLIKSLKYKPERLPTVSQPPPKLDKREFPVPKTPDVPTPAAPESVVFCLPGMPIFSDLPDLEVIAQQAGGVSVPIIRLDGGRLILSESCLADGQISGKMDFIEDEFGVALEETDKGLAKLEDVMEDIGLAMEAVQDIVILRDEKARTAKENAGRVIENRLRSKGFPPLLPHRAERLIDVDTDVERSGKKVGTVTAEISAPNVMHRVFALTKPKEDETPFAVDGSGRVYCPQEETAQALAELDLKPGEYSQIRKADQDWVVVAKREPSSGLTFGIARPIGEGLQEIRKTAVRNLGLGLGLICLAMVGILPLSKRMTRGLTKLTEGAHELATGNLETRVAIKSRDEIGHLADAFNQMAQDLSEHQKRLVQQERLEKELELCQQIQKEMLPNAPLRLSFAEVQGVSIPAREVGGDFFNFFPLPEDRMAILVGDVSGKGIAAALLMANLQATLRAKLPLAKDIADLMVQLDLEVERSTPDGTFLTLFVAILDNKAATLRWVSAGHDTQYLLRSDGGLEPLASSGRPLGLLPGGGYEDNLLRIRPGDSLFLYTDGLVEAENELGEDFGTARLEAILRRESGWGLETLIADVEQAVRRHRGPMEAHDDTTMVVLKTTETD
jgi:serine phosphatase RsbU (regulator of sigma subunit)